MPASSLRISLVSAVLVALGTAAPSAAQTPSSPMSAQEDHRRMMDRLGIASLRPGPSGDPRAPNAANTDESRASPYTTRPDPLTFEDGTPVRTAADWPRRRAEIVERFDREIYGPVPADVPAVCWEVVRTAREENGGVPVIVKTLVGHVDNAAHPALSVTVDLTVTTPADATEPVPMMLTFGWAFPRGVRPAPLAAAGIEGLSRYGKAPLVAMAYEPRFAAGFIGSSGAGGAKILRRVFGEPVENLASAAEYHWFAGNFLRYAGPLAPNDLPVDAHQLIALCAPRPVFVGVGSPTVEGQWIDARGMFLAGVHARPVYRLLGRRGLDSDEFPPMETGLTGGEIAFRQHAGGHTTGPNWPAFLAWASRYLAPTDGGR